MRTLKGSRIKLKQGKRAATSPSTSSKGNSTKGNSDTTDRTADLYKSGAQKVELAVRYAYLPIAWGGVLLSSALQQVLSERSYPLIGWVVGVGGIAVSVEAYAVGLAGMPPFIPKLGVSDGASLLNLVGIVQSPLVWQFAFLAVLAVCFQVIENLLLRMLTSKNKPRGSSGLMLWVLVGLAVFTDLSAVWKSYSVQEFTPALLCWAIFAFAGAELGLSLAKYRR